MILVLSSLFHDHLFSLFLLRLIVPNSRATSSDRGVLASSGWELRRSFNKAASGREGTEHAPWTSRRPESPTAGGSEALTRPRPRSGDRPGGGAAPPSCFRPKLPDHLRRINRVYGVGKQPQPSAQGARRAAAGRWACPGRRRSRERSPARH
jgi:hypothetical protein